MFFFTLEGTEPPHIHIEHAERVAKFWLTPIALARSHGFRRNELTELRKIVEQNEYILLEKWNEYFSR